MPRKRKAETDRRLEAAQGKIAELTEASTAQQAEIEQLRAAVTELTAPKPRRVFRARTILHGGLDVKLRGVELAENEVWIEHVGETLVIVVGPAAEAAHAGRALPAAPRRARAEEGQPPPESTAHAVRPQVDLQELELQSVGVKMDSIAATSPFGDISRPLMMEDGRVVTNAALGPQQSPRTPGGYQDRSEEAVIAAQQYGGYTGKGPKPAGWIDPDLQPPPATPSN
jgi:hypothetical protein